MFDYSAYQDEQNSICQPPSSALQVPTQTEERRRAFAARREGGTMRASSTNCLVTPSFGQYGPMLPEESHHHHQRRSSSYHRRTRSVLDTVFKTDRDVMKNRSSNHHRRRSSSNSSSSLHHSNRSGKRQQQQQQLQHTWSCTDEKDRIQPNCDEERSSYYDDWFTTCGALSKTTTVTGGDDDRHHFLLHHHHSFLYTLLNPHSRQLPAQVFKVFITLVILVDLILFVFSTDQVIFQRFQPIFYQAEAVTSGIFLVEYVCRLMVIPEKRSYRDVPAWKARLWYAVTWTALIDLVACLPFFLEFILGVDLPSLTALRFFRLFRILKTEGSVRAIDAVYRVVYYNREILYVAALICLLLVLFTATLLYYLRPKDRDNQYDQSGDHFDSILSTLYLSTLMLTGQGGPEGAMPWYTKLVVLMTSVFSVVMFAVPASMLTWGFEAEAARMAKRARRQQREMQQQQQRNHLSSQSKLSSSPAGAPDRCDSTSEDDDNSTDEEYFNIIAGVPTTESDNRRGTFTSFGSRRSAATHGNNNNKPKSSRKQHNENAISAEVDPANVTVYNNVWDGLGDKTNYNDGNDSFIITDPPILQQDPARGPHGTYEASPKAALNRLELLEQQVRANTDKLNRILELLERRFNDGPVKHQKDQPSSDVACGRGESMKFL